MHQLQMRCCTRFTIELANLCYTESMETIEKQRIVLWGDSLGRGVVWNDARARYAYAPESAAVVAGEALGLQVENHSKFGRTAPEGLELMTRELAEGVDCDAAVIEFGGNDCNFDWAAVSAAPEGEHLPATTPETFRKTLSEMVQLLKNRGIRPILMTLPPIDARRYFRFLCGSKLNPANVLKWLGDVQQIYRFQELYSHIIEQVSFRMQSELIDLRAQCLQEHAYVTSMLCADGLHLNPLGQRFAGECICRIVKGRR